MRQRSVRSLVVLLILSLGGIGLLFTRPDVIPGLTSRAANTWVVDIDNWRRTPYERVVLSPYDFSVDRDLGQLPLAIGAWKGQEVPVTNIEVFILLEPEQLVQRKYTLPDGRYVWLSLIASRRARSFHPTEICYISDGWQTSVESEEVPLEQGSIRALRVDAVKDSWRHLVLYFYVWPDAARDLGRGVVMFKVTAPLWEDEEQTLQLEKNFIREFFTQVLR